MATKGEKLIERRINTAYGKTCSGVAIDVMDIPLVFRVGRMAILDGADDSTLEATIAAYVETIRKN